MAYVPSSRSSSTICADGGVFVCGVSGGGTWMSMAIRDSGCAIMKMMSNTSSTSIIGVTLISEETSPGLLPPADMDMGYSFFVCRSEVFSGSVTAASTRTPARRAISTASWIRPYFRPTSALK